MVEEIGRSAVWRVYVQCMVFAGVFFVLLYRFYSCLYFALMQLDRELLPERCLFPFSLVAGGLWVGTPIAAGGVEGRECVPMSSFPRRDSFLGPLNPGLRNWTDIVKKKKEWNAHAPVDAFDAIYAIRMSDQYYE